jgi:Protein  of unknown function (DUF3018)
MNADRRQQAGQRMRAYRKRLRADGLRPIQIWVPDTRAPGFAAEMRRQCQLVSQDPHEDEVLDFMEAVFDWDDVE